jgi:hypothetical protein
MRRTSSQSISRPPRLGEFLLLDDPVAGDWRARRACAPGAETAPARPEEERGGEADDTDDEQDDTDRVNVHAGDRCADGPNQGGARSYAATKPGSTPLGLEEAHRKLKVSPAEFDEVAAELGRTLDSFVASCRRREAPSAGPLSDAAAAQAAIFSTYPPRADTDNDQMSVSDR